MRHAQGCRIVREVESQRSGILSERPRLQRVDKDALLVPAEAKVGQNCRGESIVESARVTLRTSVALADIPDVVQLRPSRDRAERTRGLLQELSACITSEEAQALTLIMI